MNRYEEAVTAYWAVSTAVRIGKPGLNTSQALRLLAFSDQVPEEKWLALEMHVLEYDIIEGNTEWRPPEQKHDALILTLPMKSSISTARAMSSR